MRKRSVVFSLLLAVWIALAFSAAPAAAGETILTVNSGSGNTSWFITGEPTLVMNGFDLRNFGVNVPAVIDAVTISVEAGSTSPVTLVIYQDANGGSPVDAQLIASQNFTINAAGSFRAVLTNPVTVTQPAVWIGFLLPVDFRFFADRSGSSVLTYWAWTPGGLFDLNNLGSAQVFGPADGSAPVNLNLNGKARITAEITGSDAGGYAVQSAGAVDANLAVMQPYSLCQNLLWDTQDETISYQDRVNLHCQLLTNTFLAPANPPGYVRRGELYDIVLFKDDGVVAAQRLNVGVTHCVRPAAEDLATAVLANAYGAPRAWRILPTQRFGDLVCAEIRFGGNISYFVPGA
ncbi:MAG: hypothetical protein SF162_04395 [bacterium]|nr:hypothetical protein [bacterium]